MAKYIGLGEDMPIEDSERRVASALKNLSDEWIVLHHVSWQSKRSGRQGDGEADFIVIHPQKGMLVLEVKGGGIDIESGRWFTTNRHGDRHPIKNPYEQAVASKHALVSWMRGHSLDQKVRIGHAVFFPHMQNLPFAGPAATPEISLTKAELGNIDSAITRCFEHWSLKASISSRELSKVVELLAPTVSAFPDLAIQSSDAEAKILTFTAEQIEVFAGLRAHRGGLILGRAGTGKTVLAVARAQQLARDGFNTLLVCYSELLGNDLSSRIQTTSNLTACTFHSLCLNEAHRAKLDIPKAKPPKWWEKQAPDLLIEACSINEAKYDAIIVDEGQDFSPLWLDALRCLLSKQSDDPFFIFADPLQDLWRRDWQQGTEHSFVWELTRNMRNTQPIADRVAAAVSETWRGSGVAGPEPTWQITDGAPGEKNVLSAVEHLINNGLGPSSLVVLCESSSLVTRLRERAVGPYSFGRWGGRGIVVETVARFKGLEAPAIVLALAPSTEENDLTGAYVGMSRARSVLTVIGSEANSRHLNWPMQK